MTWYLWQRRMITWESLTKLVEFMEKMKNAHCRKAMVLKLGGGTHDTAVREKIEEVKPMKYITSGYCSINIRRMQRGNLQQNWSWWKAQNWEYSMQWQWLSYTYGHGTWTLQKHLESTQHATDEFLQRLEWALKLDRVGKVRIRQRDRILWD